MHDPQICFPFSQIANTTYQGQLDVMDLILQYPIKTWKSNRIDSYNIKYLAKVIFLQCLEIQLFYSQTIYLKLFYYCYLYYGMINMLSIKKYHLMYDMVANITIPSFPIYLLDAYAYCCDDGMCLMSVLQKNIPSSFTTHLFS